MKSTRFEGRSGARCENGDIFVKGKLAENDKEDVDALREFLKGQGFLK